MRQGGWFMMRMEMVGELMGQGGGEVRKISEENVGKGGRCME